MNATTLTPFWTQQEIDRLDEFLTREGGPQNTMDAAMIDGYICALVSGPRLIAPSEALRWIWDTEKGQDNPSSRARKRPRTSWASSCGSGKPSVAS